MSTLPVSSLPGVSAKPPSRAAARAADGAATAPAPLAAGGDPGADALTAIEAHLEAVAPGYLERVRRAAAALGVESNRRAGVAAAARAVRDAAPLDLEAPTSSATAPGVYLKVAVKRLTTWYLRYLTVQVATFANAVAALSEALVARLDELEAVGDAAASRTAEVERAMAELTARVEHLESAAAGPDSARRP